MKNLYYDINVTTNENDAIGDYLTFYVDDWIENGTVNDIYMMLNNAGIYESDYVCFEGGVEIIENALDSAYVGQAVYFWVDE